jgi:hypothetical protein
MNNDSTGVEPVPCRDKQLRTLEVPALVRAVSKEINDSPRKKLRRL